MAPKYDEAPEVAPDTDPEVYPPSSDPEVSAVHGPPPPLGAYAPVKEENTPINQAYGDTSPQVDNAAIYGYVPSGYGTASTPPDESKHGKAHKRLCGCSVLVFILSVIIALLSVAVIGLAAGTGVASSRANDKENQLDALGVSGASQATVTTTVTASATPTASAEDRGCSSDSDGVTGTNYTTQFFDKPTYRIYCNSDTPHAPLISLFVGTFDDCIDACAHWTHYLPSDFSSNSTRNETCAGLSFIPLWTDRTDAFDGGAPGNCYLKPGPLNETSLTTPNIGTACHAAVLVDDS